MGAFGVPDGSAVLVVCGAVCSFSPSPRRMRRPSVFRPLPETATVGSRTIRNGSHPIPLCVQASCRAFVAVRDREYAMPCSMMLAAAGAVVLSCTGMDRGEVQSECAPKHSGAWLAGGSEWVGVR